MSVSCVPRCRKTVGQKRQPNVQWASWRVTVRTVGSSSIPPEVRSYCVNVARMLEEYLGRDLVGLYLHGSAAMGAWTPTRSDVDLLSVATRSLKTTEKQAIGRALLTMPAPGVGVEFSLVADSTARVVNSSSSPFELHVDGEGGRIVEGTGRDDPDLLAHFAMTRARGISIVGPPASDVIGEPLAAALRKALASDLAWGMDQGNYSYALLNACRCLMYLREGTLGSKVEGAEWAKAERVVPAEPVDVALAVQRGDSLNQPRAEATRRFVMNVRSELLKLAEDEPHH